MVRVLNLVVMALMVALAASQEGRGSIVRQVLAQIQNSEKAEENLQTVLRTTSHSRFVDCLLLEGKGNEPCRRESLYLHVAVKQMSLEGFRCEDCTGREQKLMNTLVNYITADRGQCVRLLNGLNVDSSYCS